MVIRFNCPDCSKPLKVPERLAGKKGPCPNCKHVIEIPAETAVKAPAQKVGAKGEAPPPSDSKVEDLAADLLSDEPEEKAGDQAEIELECPYCFEEIKFEAVLAGKRAPCPECTRILEVPKLEKTNKKDWRNVRTDVPSGAAVADEPPPDGAWDTRKGKVSEEAMLKAGAIKEARPPVTTRDWVRRGVLTALVLGVMIGSTLFVLNWLQSGRIEDALEQAMQGISAEQQKANKLTPEQVAAVHLTAGKFHLATGELNSVKPAEGNNGSWNQFSLARQNLFNRSTVESDLLLSDLAVAQIGLGGNADQVRDGKRLSWERTLNEIAQTLRGIKVAEQRALATRRVARQLIAMGQVNLAKGLGTAVIPLPLITIPDSDAPRPEKPDHRGFEIVAVIAQELQRAGKSPDAKDMAQQIIGSYPELGEMDKPVLPSMTPTIVAACRAFLDQLPPTDPKDKQIVAIGEVIAKAWKGDVATALQDAEVLATPAHRFEGYLGIAEATGDSTAVQSAYGLLSGGLKDRISPWYGFHLFEAARNGKTQKDQLPTLIGAVEHPALGAWCHLQIARAAVSGSADAVSTDLLKDFKGSLAYDVGLIEISRHNASRTDMEDTVEEWEAGKKPFGFIGIALGLQEQQRE